VSEQGKRLQRRKQEDAAFNKMLLWLAGAVVLEILTFLLRRIYINYSYTDFGVGLMVALNSFFGVFRFAGAVLTVAGAVWLLLSLKGGKKLVAPGVFTGVMLWLWAASVLCFGLNTMGMQILCVLPVAVAVLAAIYFLYQREFFYNTILVGIGITALWVYRQIYMNHPRMTYCGFAAVWVGLAAAAALAFLLSRRKGKLGFLRVLPAGAGYPSIYLTCAVTAAVLLAALLVGIAVAYYAIFALIGWLFCLAVYYTVKLM
jgi:hypothetical protein